MSEIKNYPQIADNPSLLTLLETIGCNSVRDFIAYDSHELHDEMFKANKFLGLELEVPARTLLLQLQQQLAAQNGLAFEQKPQQRQPEKVAAQTEELPQARLLHYTGPKQQEFLAGLRQAKVLGDAVNNSGFDNEQEDSAESYRDSVGYRPKKQPIFIPRGVTSLHPTRSYLTALVVVAWHVALMFCMVSGLLIYINELSIPFWFYACVVGTLLLGIMYLMMRMNCPCSICRQPILNRKKCKYHRQSHKIWGMSVTLCTALHILCFRWFRCPYCGTSQRIDRKKS